MDYHELGRTGLGVSPICLATMGYGPPTTQSQVDEIAGATLDLGANFIDTDNCYDGLNWREIVQGTSETMLGTALRERCKDVAWLTTAVELRILTEHFTQIDRIPPYPEKPQPGFARN